MDKCDAGRLAVAPVAIRGMPMEQDSAYFTRRENEERAAAAVADHPGARRAHLELADRYRQLATAEEKPVGADSAANTVLLTEKISLRA